MMVEITQEELRKLRAAKEMLDPNDRRHGTPSGYTIGCRCESCKQARSRYKKQRRIARWREGL